MAVHSGATEGPVEDDDAASHQLHHNATDDDDNTVVVATAASAAAESELVATQSVCGRKLHRTVEIVQQQHRRRDAIRVSAAASSLCWRQQVNLRWTEIPRVRPQTMTFRGEEHTVSLRLEQSSRIFESITVLVPLATPSPTNCGTMLLWENVITSRTNCVETTSVLRAYAPGNLKLSADNGFGLAGHGGWFVHSGVIGEMTIWDLRT
ncbi:hypothetical protein DFJ73DRAFT_905684 [Zopfochytrium polystomum]|nr:hypothetical protein DFJ73DRAFT_905684 [Zopfochytrium polystomum]